MKDAKRAQAVEQGQRLRQCVGAEWEKLMRERVIVTSNYVTCVNSLIF